MEVYQSAAFARLFSRLPMLDKVKIAEFIFHVQTQGFAGLKGRNRSSDCVPTDDPLWLKKVKLAQQYNLWHYHIGIPAYNEAANGDLTSKYVLHYIKGDDFIKIVDLSEHPPFRLPSEDSLN